ncbi:MAG: ATPase [Desulfurococcaceae archaeon]
MIDPLGLAYIGAVLPLIGGVMGSTTGMKRATSAGASVLAEDPAQFKNVLILAALPMTQTFYGLIQMIYTLQAYIPGVEITIARALGILATGFIGFLAEWLSAWVQGIVCASGISELPRTKGKNFMSTVILAVYVELWGILGIVFTILSYALIG